MIRFDPEDIHSVQYNTGCGICPSDSSRRRPLLHAIVLEIHYQGIYFTWVHILVKIPCCISTYIP